MPHKSSSSFWRIILKRLMFHQTWKCSEIKRPLAGALIFLNTDTGATHKTRVAPRQRVSELIVFQIDGEGLIEYSH